MTKPRSAVATLGATLRRWVDVETIRHHEDKVLLVLTLIIGAIVGLVVVAFILLTENLGSRLYPEGGAAWRRAVIPVLGALLTGFLLQRYFPNARGSGIPQTKTALFIHGGVIRMRTVLGKFGCSSVSLASGIALGREGPSVQVGAGIASSLGRAIGLSPSRTKALVPIGASAALAAAFNTPIAAVLFSLEEVMGDMHAPVLGSIVLSSATSWMVLHLILGDEPLFHVPAYQLVHPVELGLYAVLGILGGFVSVAFVKLLLWQRRRFLDLPTWSRWIQPTAGGLLVGGIGWFVPAVVGVGYDHVDKALNGQTALGVMALLVALKLVTTATCYASGNAGGIFGPSLFIGAMLGGAFGGAAHTLFPDYTGGVGAYALVGMGVAFAGIVRVPLTSVIMIFEVTRDYSIIVPLMISNLMSHFISARLQKEPIYEALLHQDGIYLPSGAGAREELTIVDEGTRPPKAVTASETVEHLLGSVPEQEATWPVVDPGGLLLGMLTRAQLEEAAREGRGAVAVAELLPPLDDEEALTEETFPHVHPDHPLDTAFRRMAEHGLSVLPVVSRTNVRTLVGTISLQDALAAYGLEKAHEGSGKRKAETSPPPAAVGGVLAAFVATLALAGVLSYFYRTDRAARARRSFETANELMESSRYPEAVERYRTALSISHSPEHRLALGLALVKAGLLGEAEIYLREVVRAEPRSGPANLGRARIAARTGDLNQAVNDYHLAVAGKWPPESQNGRLDAHLELVDLLGKSGRKAQAQAELMQLRMEFPHTDAAFRQLGDLLLQYGLPKQAAESFQEILRRNPRDARAYAALGEAESALADYGAARDAFRAAVRWDPSDAGSRRRLEVTDAVLGLDPTVRGLPSVQRYRRSQEVLRATVAAAERCLTPGGSAPAPAVAELSSAAKAAIGDGARPASYADASDRNLTLARELWTQGGAPCASPTPTEEAIAIVLPRAAR